MTVLTAVSSNEVLDVHISHPVLKRSKCYRTLNLGLVLAGTWL